MTNARRKLITEACCGAEYSRAAGCDGTVTLPAHEVLGLLNPEPVKEPKALRRVVRIQSNKVKPEHVFAIFDDNTIESYELETDMWGSVLHDMQQHKADKGNYHYYEDGTSTDSAEDERVPTPVEDERVQGLEKAIHGLRDDNAKLEEKLADARKAILDVLDPREDT